MASTTGPLLSLGASGSVAGTLTFASWKGRSYVRQLVIPSNPKSNAQTAQRAMQKFLSQAWKNLTAAQQASWEAAASAGAYSPFNAYTSANLRRWTDFLAGSKANPPTTGGTSPTLGVTTLTGRSSGFDITQAINPAAQGDGWGLAVYVSATTGFTPTKTTTKVILPFDADNTIGGSVSNLAPGTWFVRVQPYLETGEKGTLAAQDSVVTT